MKRRLGEVVPIPKGTTTLQSFVKPKGAAKESNNDTQFQGNTREPTQKETRRLIELLMSKSTEAVM